MVELMDLSSAIQLACGINFAGSVIMERHDRFVHMHAESVDYARNVVMPQAQATGATKDKLDEVSKWAAILEHDIYLARFGSIRSPMRSKIRKLQYLCSFAGVIATIALLVPAFMPHLTITDELAVFFLIVIFMPIPYALLRIRRWHLKSEKPIFESKENLLAAIKKALHSTP